MGQRGWKGEIVLLACFVFYFIREHENLVLDPSNNIYITMKNDDRRARGSRKPLGKTRNKLFNLNIIKISIWIGH